MKLITFLVIAFVLSARTCRTEIVIPTPSPDESTSNFVKDLVKIVTSCYGDGLRTVGLAGSLPDALSRILSTEHSIPVVLIDDARNYTDNAFFVPEQFQHKVHVFIMEASTSQQLDVIIQKNIKFSIWWNHMASFLLVDRSPGCVNSEKFLWNAWYRNVLNAKVLCYESESARTIYNYNPFTDQAPVPWQRHAVRQGIIDHPFNLFYRKYRANESICINLDFDKTKDLGGYEIGVIGYDFSKLNSSKLHNRHKRIFLLPAKMVSTVCCALNGKTKYSGINHDIAAILRPIGWDLLKAYPYTVFESVLVSQFRDNKSQVKEFLSVIDVDLRIGIAIVYLVTIIFLKCFVHQAIMPTFLNIIRITCNTRFTNLPDKSASRIFISCLLLFSLIMQGIVQCKLAVQLTTKIPLQNVNTMEDIEKFGYKVYGMFTDADLRNLNLNKGNLLRCHTIKDCYEYVKTNPSIAYLNNFWLFDVDEAQEVNLHVSRKSVTTSHMSLPIRRDWALEQTVNRIIAKLVEAAALEPWNYKFLRMNFRGFPGDKEVEYTVAYKPLNFDALKFAFRILGLGLASAIVCFIFELVIGYKFTCRFTREPRRLSYTVLTVRINHCHNIM